MTTDPTTPRDPVLIWSNERKAYWRANACGYTSDPREAGVYERSEAEKLTPPNHRRLAYGGRLVEPREVESKLWRLRDLPMLARLGLLPVPERTAGFTIPVDAPAVRLVLDAEHAQRVVDGLVRLGSPRALALARTIVAMAQPKAADTEGGGEEEAQRHE